MTHSPLFKSQALHHKLANTDERLLDRLLFELYEHRQQPNTHLQDLRSILNAALPNHGFLSTAEEDEHDAIAAKSDNRGHFVAPTVH